MREGIGAGTETGKDKTGVGVIIIGHDTYYFFVFSKGSFRNSCNDTLVWVQWPQDAREYENGGG
jgi:hypothetical protein